MTTVTVPSNLRFSNAKVTLKRQTLVLQSPLTGRRQTATSAFAVWEFEGDLIPYEGTEAASIRSFLVALQGRRNTFSLPVPGVEGPASGYNGFEGRVNGAGQTGNSLDIDGLSNSVPYLHEGDYFTVNGELKVATASVSSNGSGQVTVTFEPSLRSSPADNALIEITAPTVTLAAADDTIASWELSAPVIHDFKFKAQEAF